MCVRVCVSRNSKTRIVCSTVYNWRVPLSLWCDYLVRSQLLADIMTGNERSNIRIEDDVEHTHNAVTIREL